MKSNFVYDALSNAHHELLVCVAGTVPEFQDQVNALIDRYQADWDSGSSFIVSIASFLQETKRTGSDDDKELSVCVERLSGEILSLYLNHILSGVSRTAMISTLQTVISLDYNFGKIRIAGYDMIPQKLMSYWNQANPSQSPIQFQSDWAI